MSHESHITVTPGEVRRRVDQVREHSGDPEVAHGLEDDLHQYVLRAIAEGRCEEPARCAAIAVETRAIDFARWYA